MMGALVLSDAFPFHAQACDRLLAMRVDAKMRTRKADSILNRVHVAMPAPRDQKERKPFIPGMWLARMCMYGRGNRCCVEAACVCELCTETLVVGVRWRLV